MNCLPSFIRRSVKAKLLVSFLLLGLLPLAIVGYLAYERSRTALIDRTSSMLQEKARTVLDKIDRSLSERCADAQAFAFNPMARGTPEQISAAANFYVTVYGVYDLIVVADEEGKVVALNSVAHDGRPIDTKRFIGMSVRSEPWFTESISGRVRRGESFTGDAAIDPWVSELYGKNDLTLSFSAPIVNEKGDIVGVWANQASWARVVAPILNAERQALAQLGETTETQVISRTGLILDDYDPKAVLTFNLADRGLQCARLVTEGKSGVTTEVHLRRKEAQINGYATSHGYGSYRGHGWGALVRQDLSNAYAEVKSLRNFVCLVAFLTMVVISGAAYFYADGIVKPLQLTIASLERVADGDLTQRVQVGCQDEVGQMAAALNRAVAGIRTAVQLDQVDWQLVGQQRDEMARLTAIVESTEAKIMYTDPALKIQYLNPASLKQLKQLEDYLPVKAEQIVGQSVDIFHDSSTDQGNVLLAPENLPYREIVQVGPEKLELAYNAIRDSEGNYVGPMFTWEVVTEKLKLEEKNIDYAGQISAISKSQAVVEFELNGNVITANENFLEMMGYTLDDIKGRHHSLFVADAYRQGSEYKKFWTKLGQGEYQAGEYLRIGKGGKKIWLQASYNPIFDVTGKPLKVVKYAMNISEQVCQREQLREIVTSVAQNAAALGDSANELSAFSREMTDNAEETSAQANLVSAAAEQVSCNVQTVATSVEEMGVSIREIATNANQAAKVAQQAVLIAEKTNQTISKLGESSQQIGKVIKVITSIAEQTNLLALNATIEAARAGEAGKGFAVVANEVKELAKETARATDDIGQRIEAIQNETHSAIQAIDQIGQIIDEVNDISNTIASAVEEQTVTTSEISRNVTEAAKGSGEIAQNITGVAKAAQSTTQGANNTQQAAAVLSRMSNELQQIVTWLKRKQTPNVGESNRFVLGEQDRNRPPESLTLGA